MIKYGLRINIFTKLRNMHKYIYCIKCMYYSKPHAYYPFVGFLNTYPWVHKATFCKYMLQMEPCMCCKVSFAMAMEM